MGLVHCAKTLVAYYETTSRNIPLKRRPQAGFFLAAGLLLQNGVEACSDAECGGTNSSCTPAVKSNSLKSGNKKQILKLITASGKELKNPTKQKSWASFVCLFCVRNDECVIWFEPRV